jgi:nitroreductase
MEFQKSVIEIIKMRKSYRTYNGKLIENITLQKLIDYIGKTNEEVKIKVRFILVNNNDIDGRSVNKLGTYGFMSGARSFIVGIMDKQEKDALEFGFLFEKIVLFATDLGLQTCWLGGTFNKSDFQQSASILENEFIPIVSPVGFKKEKPRFLESAMRTVVGADKRKPWNELFFEGNSAVPLSEDNAGSYAIPLEMVRLGPSASNKQPWRIIKDINAFHFFLCRTKGYGVTFYDLQKNDIGIAKCHFELSANELGLKGNWQEMKNINTPIGWEYISTWS